MSDIQATTILAFSKGLITPFAIEPGLINLFIAGDNAIKKTEVVGMTDGTLDLGAVGTIGCVAFHNTQAALPPPATDPVITQGGTPGTNANSYVLVFHYVDGSLSVSDIVANFLGNATLSGTNYNILTWTNPTGVTSVDVYRVVAGGSPSTLGKIGTGVTSPFHDTGIAGDGATTPIGIPSNYAIEYGADGSSYPNQVLQGEAWSHRWNGAAIHRKALVTPTEWEYLIIEL